MKQQSMTIPARCIDATVLTALADPRFDVPNMALSVSIPSFIDDPLAKFRHEQS